MADTTRKNIDELRGRTTRLEATMDEFVRPALDRIETNQAHSWKKLGDVERAITQQRIDAAGLQMGAKTIALVVGVCATLGSAAVWVLSQLLS